MESANTYEQAADEVTFLYKADPIRGQVWAEVFGREAPHVRFRMWPDIGNPSEVEYLAAWEPPEDLDAFPNLRVLFSTGAGIDQFDLNRMPDHVPLVRMIEPGIVEGMVEYVTLSVLALHRDMPAYRRQQAQGNWMPLQVRSAESCRVGVLGLGSLGQAVLARLASFGFDCAGWARSAHRLEGVQTYCGWSVLDAFLARTDILVCLLPLTEETRGILDGSLFSKLPRGAKLVHVGRGQHLDAAALMTALDDGMLGDAILDVTEPEPLPPENPLWRHPHVWITPHVASMTRPDTAARVVLENLQRMKAGVPMVGLVDRAKGY
ncbi:2-hydroxyacid dehydrogenase [Burkholderia ubonensis]|uniref:2-hydroxyacid dehydrogenase n=1 Tax=Burkholderia ubonensis TaxID=101571 RepID=UPI000756399C|nr:glyoxylate/hydroxypyruvate reductase A [Burkholderia ubonensis]KVS41159.1 glyoxylate/hydroxypyruvate reductase A [Burkholderia ubonensis]KVS45825.1 glyoxylate/hydroxypyruvate reductase A [Burkholderia ubonensis]KVS79699.1 glyoxylate/hydroxypyruvate reductase A [Burkholderia ubonensis]KVS87450.1 glyoxylate/hydroxypyruvate reductase A [Burkholderia ubonensis]KVS94611.1 glyoxylate/hydroxypyruvate reductase A [Burkholderia ubonensis]